MPLYHLGVLIVHRVTRSLVVFAPRVGPIAWANGEANRGNVPDAARWAHLDWQPNNNLVDLHISGSWGSILNNNTSYTKRMCFVFQPTCTPVDAGRRRSYCSLGAGGRIEIASFRALAGTSHCVPSTRYRRRRARSLACRFSHLRSLPSHPTAHLSPTAAGPHSFEGHRPQIIYRRPTNAPI